MTDDNVVHLPSQLDTLAEKIRIDLKRRESGREEWVDATVNLCVHLYEARDQFKSNDSFSEWRLANGFGDNVLNKNDRAAAIHMGEHPGLVRSVLEKTERSSLQLIYAEEFRFPNARKTPKTTKPPHPTPQTDKAQEVLEGFVQRGEKPPPTKELAKDIGVGQATVEKARDRISQKQYPQPVDPESFSFTMKERYEATIRAKVKELEATYSQRRAIEIQQHFDEYILPTYGERKAEADAVIASRKGIFTKAEFNKIRACLHPDRSPEKGELETAFALFNKQKLILVAEAENPTKAPPLPKTWQEMVARKKTKR